MKYLVILLCACLASCATRRTGNETAVLGAHIAAADTANAAATNEGKAIRALNRNSRASSDSIQRHTDAALSDAKAIENKTEILLRDYRRHK